MTKKRFKDYCPEQPVLFRTYINDWLPKDHPVHFISEVVEKLDLSEIHDDYRESRGQPPYEPLMMVKVLVYAMYKGIHSSRKIEQALYEDVAFRLLSANQQPDHWTISGFRRRHHKAMGNLFDQTVKLAVDAGLVKLEHVSVDGTKIKANVSKQSAMSYAYMQKEEGRLREEIEKILNRMEEIDRVKDNNEHTKAIQAINRNDPTGLLAALAVAKSKTRDTKKREKIRNLKEDILSIPEAVRDYRARLKETGYDTKGMRGLGAAESNVDRFSNRLKKRGQSRKIEGLKAMVYSLFNRFEGKLKSYAKDIKKIRELVIEDKPITSAGRIARKVIRESIGAKQVRPPALDLGTTSSGGLSKFLRELNDPRAVLG